MMKIILASIMIAGAASTARASIVYNNTTTSLNLVNALLPTGEVNSPEHGNQVNLAGVDRMVTHITSMFHITGTGVATFKARIRFYNNDGPGGQPGTQLWDSGPQFGLLDSGGNLPLNFNVPNIRVPHSFTWTVQITERRGFNTSLLGPAEYNPPTVGSAPFGYWHHGDGGPNDWQFTGINEPPFGAHIDASPIPADLNHDGNVGPADLAQLLATWGPCPAPPASCAADLDHDQQVGPADLAQLLSQWG